MTVSITTDHQLIRQTIRDWLVTYAGVAQVDYANQMVERPAKPYGTILILSSGIKGGVDEDREEFDTANNVIKRTTAGPRQIVAQCEIYTDPATTPGPEAAELLENALLALDTVPVQDVLRAAKIGFLGHTPIVRLDEQHGSRWERRAVVDVTFIYSGEALDDGLTGESGNWVESVELPSESNENADYGVPVGGVGLIWTNNPRPQNITATNIGGDPDGQIRVVCGLNNTQTSLDKGDTWTTVQNSGNWQGIHCTSDGVCILVGAAAGARDIQRSDDWGMTWSDVNHPDVNSTYYEVIYDPVNKVWVAAGQLSGGARPMRSTDGGLNWAFSDDYLDSQVDCWGLTVTNSGRIVGVGVGVKTDMYSDNGGRTWVQSFGSNARDVTCDPKTGNLIKVGINGRIEISEDEGETWIDKTPITSFSNTLESVDANAIGVIVAVGQDQTILRSIDGGNTWQIIQEFASATDLTGVFHGGISWNAVGFGQLNYQAP